MAVKQDTVAERIKEILKKEFEDDTVDVSCGGVRDNLHIVIMSRKFDRMKHRKRQEYVWALIDQSDLRARDKRRISMILPLSPDDAK